jgi:hypothetical protein
MELTLKVGRDDIEILHRHDGRVVGEQFLHECLGGLPKFYQRTA